MRFKTMDDKLVQSFWRPQKMKFSPIAIRNCLVAGTPLLAALSVGGSTTFPMVLMHQLTSNDSSIPLDFETSTWIGSIAGFAGLPSILVPSLMQWRGRRLAFIVACLIVAIGWIVAFTAQNVTSILISECLQGLGSNSVMAISLLSISEMTAPRFREMFMQMYFSSQMITMSICGLLTHYLHWRTVAFVMFVPAVISIICAMMWPESPYWLAYKGDINKCIESFVWLRGSDEAATKELDDLIKSKKENTIKHHRNSKAPMRRFWEILRDKAFYLPALHMILLDFMVYWSGAVVVLIYSTELIKRSTHNEHVIFFSSFIINSLLLLGFLCCMFVGKYITNKTRLLCCTVMIICCLIGASLVTYFQKFGAVSKNSSLCLIFLMFYSFFCGLGLSSSTYPLSSSLMPVKYRGIGGALLILNTCVFHTTSLKVAPYLLVYITMSGTFLVYASIAMICGIIVWKFVPDTDGKTLQEIEHFYTKGVWNDPDVKEHLKELQVIINDH